jgi:cytochrome c oxidase assembly factor CtaG/cytochrome c2
MHAGLIPLLHESVPWRGAWTWTLAPGIVVPLLIVGALYVLGVRGLERRGLQRLTRGSRQLCFAIGWLVMVLALVSPLHTMSDQLFTAHMVQHELLMAVAAPLLVAADPFVALLVALPTFGRRALARALSGPRARRAWNAVSRPSVAFAIHAVAIWVWHVPGLFQQTLTSGVVHGAQHVSFVVTAALFWWSLTDGSRVPARGAAILYLFATTLHTGALGALLAFSRTVWYPAYANAATAWGLTPLEDQQLAGLIMWIPGSVPYLIAALLLFRSWLASSSPPRATQAGGPAVEGVELQIRQAVGRRVTSPLRKLILLLAGTAVLGSATACRDTDAATFALVNGRASRGPALMRAYGCGACHTVPGVRGANAVVGPPLAGIASRSFIAGVLANTPENMVAWIQNPPAIDSKTAMPNLRVGPRDAADIAAYLYTLR